MSNPLAPPLIGPWLGKIGRVIDILNMPCTPTDTMWTRGFFTAIPYMVISLFKPDPIDTMLERLGQPHRRRRRARFSIDAIIQGDLLPGPQGLEKTALFSLGVWAQRVGWWFCIIDAGVDLAYNWASSTMQYAGCIPDHQGPCKLNNPASPLIPGEQGVLLWTEVSDPDNWNTIDGIFIPPGVDAAVSVSINANVWGPAGPPAGSCSVQVIDELSGQVLMKTPPLNQQGGVGSSFANFRKNVWTGVTGKHFRCHFHNFGGYSDLAGSTFQAMGAGNSSLSPDP